MEILVSTPGSPGTSFTDNVKDKIVCIFDVLANKEDFDNVRTLGRELEKYDINWNYARNILPFLQNCGFVKYQSNSAIVNKEFFTDLGYAFVDILKCIALCDGETTTEKIDILSSLREIEEIILFQGIVELMKNQECNYSRDFFDVLSFVNLYGSIDSTEYLLIQYMRENEDGDYLVNMKNIVNDYRNHVIEISVRTKTKNGDSGEAKSVNSFPYVHGNFAKAGVFEKSADNRFVIVERRRDEVKAALMEVGERWANSVK
ncbi:hypothetical protein ACTQ56_10565 [[Clostridium] aminophilum]|uniref:hypothetical protein n=1 Tax=[Clostridium] aminophilum TaxID=1526 RepID=UPI003F9B171F